MLASALLASLTDHPRAGTLMLVLRRRAPLQQALGLLAVAAQDRAYGDGRLLDATLAAALALPERTQAQRSAKAELLLRAIALLARANLSDLALRLAPAVPLAPGTGEVLTFSTDSPAQIFCWRVAPAYALVSGRRPQPYPTERLIQPYRRGLVAIDDPYLHTVLLPTLREPDPILLLPHPYGLVDLDGHPHIILDGNHRVVWAWKLHRPALPGIRLTDQEGEAVLVSHSRYPPYARG